MTDQELHKLKFPIGKFVIPKEVTEALKQSWMGIIKDLPSKLEEALKDVTQEQLNYCYRPEGWKVKQVVHHMADSHMNAFIRTKMALTEDNPTIKAYRERPFAELPDSQLEDLESSMLILKGLHIRFSTLLESMNEDDFAKTYIHSQSKYTYRLDSVLALYAWHSMHHLHHIKQALASNGAYNP